jgi:hypothetical protein
MKIQLDFNAEVGRENIFKLAIRTESLHQDSNNNNWVRIVNIATSKNFVVKSIIFPHRNFHKYTWTSLDGQTHNQIDHLLIDRRWHSSILDMQSFREIYCDSNHNLVVAKVRKTLAVRKQAAQKFDGRRFNPRNLNDLEVRKQYQIDITNSFAALENVSEDENINRAWKSIKKIKTSATESLGMHEMKQLNPWFDEECLVILDQKKQAKMVWIQDPSQSNVDNLNNVRRDASRHFRNKQKAYFKAKIEELELTVRSTISGTCIGAIMASRSGISLELG